MKAKEGFKFRSILKCYNSIQFYNLANDTYLDGSVDMQGMQAVQSGSQVV